MATHRAHDGDWITDPSEDEGSRSHAVEAPPAADRLDGPLQAAARAQALAQAGGRAGAMASGRGLDASHAGMVLGMQQRAGNQAVQRYLNDGPLLQRKEGEAAAADVTPAASAPGGAAAPAAPAAPAAGTGTATLTLSAIYENVPGESKTKVRKAGEKDALWFDPLKTHSDAPSVADSTKAQGILTGGQQQIESFAAPVTNGAKRIGRGSISAQLKYTKKKDQSYDVVVSDVSAKDKRAAEKAAKAFVKEKMDVYGDVDDIARQAGESLASSYPGAKVAITVKPDTVVDTGRSSFYYKLRGSAGILLDVEAVPVAEKQTTIGGSKTTGTTTDDETSNKSSSESGKRDINKKVTDAERTKAKSKEMVEATYNEAVVKTLDDYVTKVTKVHDTVSSDLAQKVVTDADYSKKDHEATSSKRETVTNYTKNIEKGEKSKDNWAEKIKKAVKVAKKVTSIPFIDKIPGVGWLSRKVKQWQLDLIEEAADIFAETGKVQFEDEKIESKSTDDSSGKTDSTSNIKRHDVQETTRRLTEEYKKETNEDWKRHLDEVTTTSKEYKSLTTKESESATDKTHDEKFGETTQKDASEAADKHRTVQNQSVTANFSVQQTTTFSVPVVKATVVNGDAEVSASPFGPDPDETAAPAGTPAPNP